MERACLGTGVPHSISGQNLVAFLLQNGENFASNCIRFYNKLPHYVSEMTLNKLKGFVKTLLIK